MILDEYWKVAKRLRDHYELFYTCWHLGKPAFTESIPTAAVSFNRKSGTYLSFYFNPTFHQSLDGYQRAFVVGHECLHVILNHGKRFKGKIAEIANLAADLVINELLITRYGFDKEQLVTNETLKGCCWFDTMFTLEDGTPDKSIPRDRHFEYYYDLLLDKALNGLEIVGAVLDDHSGLENATIDNVMDAIRGNADTGLGEKEKKLLEGLKKLYKNDSNKEAKQAGVNPGDVQKIIDADYKPAYSWTKIVKSMKSAARIRERERDTWTGKHRRHTLLPDRLILPTCKPITAKEYNKVDLVAFMDISGSCIHLVDEFYAVLNTVPTDIFNLIPHTFDTIVREIDLKTTKIIGGGGTSFIAIENYIRENFEKYPYAVMIITDGAGDNVSPQHPERWHWILSDNYTQYIDKTSKIFQIQDFKGI